jgi:hypothetical protein
MTVKHYSGSCHCKSVRYEVDLDLAKGTMRCNCSICTKSRAWFAFVNAPQFKMVSGEESLLDYQWTPPTKPAPFLTYRFCKNCGVRIYGTGDAPSMGGRMYAIAVATLDDVNADELAAAPLKFVDGLHDRFDKAPEDTRLL